MLRKDFILCKTRNLLNEFIRPITAVADKPRQRFLCQTLKAILLSGSLVVSELAFFIHDKCSYRSYTLKHLLNHLTSPPERSEESQNHLAHSIAGRFTAPQAVYPVILFLQ
jgi:hypothetical protein